MKSTTTRKFCAKTRKHEKKSFVRKQIVHINYLLTFICDIMKSQEVANMRKKCIFNTYTHHISRHRHRHTHMHTYIHTCTHTYTHPHTLKHTHKHTIHTHTHTLKEAHICLLNGIKNKAIFNFMFSLYYFVFTLSILAIFLLNR